MCCFDGRPLLRSTYLKLWEDSKSSPQLVKAAKCLKILSKSYLFLRCCYKNHFFSQIFFICVSFSTYFEIKIVFYPPDFERKHTHV